MQESWIETFLAIAKTRNITDASTKLFLSQSTVSTRLKQLEDYLGYKLFIRHKGLSKIDLTERGEDFLPLAKEYQKLTKSMKDGNLSSGSMKLKIAATNSVIQAILYLYIGYVKEKNDDILFKTTTKHSVEIYDEVNEDKVDLGISLKNFKYPGIQTAELIDLDFYIFRLTSSNSKDLQSLSMDDYIYIPWGFEVDEFLVQNFDNKESYHMFTDSVITGFLSLSNKEWLLAPKSFINLIPDNMAIDYYWDNNLPNYKAYLVYKTNSYQNKSKLRSTVDSIVNFYKNYNFD